MEKRISSSVIPDPLRNPINNKSHRFRIKSGMTAAIASRMTAAAISGIATVVLFLTTLWGGAALAADPVSTTSSTDLNLSIAEVISLQITSPCNSGNALTLAITPTATGALSSCPDIVRVDTNTPGYTLSFKSSSSSLTHTSITSPTTPTIPPTNNGTTPAQLDLNSWGFAIPNKTLNGYGAFDTTYAQRTNASQPTTTDKYATTPTTDTEIAKLDTGNANNNTVVVNANTTVFFGTAADMNLVAGEYTTTLTYTAIGEPIPAPPTYPKVANGAYFQDTTIKQSESCTSLPIYNSINPDPASTVTMIDNRNNQQYQVRRLQDGKCWMIDNMKLADVTLTSTDSNVTTNFVLPPNLITTANGTGTGRIQNGRCDSGTASGTGGYLTCDGTSTRSITNSGFAAIVDPSANTYCAGTTNMPPDTITKCGYLYNWYTATAGTGTYGIASYTQASSSICPVGWKLPSATSSATGPGNGSSYNYADIAVLNASMNANTYATPDATSDYVAGWQPGGSFAGVFSGRWSNSLSSGTESRLWSSSGYVSDARFIGFDTSRVYAGGTSTDTYRGYGVRCVVGS